LCKSRGEQPKAGKNKEKKTKVKNIKEGEKRNTSFDKDTRKSSWLERKKNLEGERKCGQVSSPMVF